MTCTWVRKADTADNLVRLLRLF
eukprot:COSAG01_NODE_15160_length_1367_cov_1.043375_1_plen_22_part_10